MIMRRVHFFRRVIAAPSLKVDYPKLSTATVVWKVKSSEGMCVPLSFVGAICVIKPKQDPAQLFAAIVEKLGSNGVLRVPGSFGFQEAIKALTGLMPAVLCTWPVGDPGNVRSALMEVFRFYAKRRPKQLAFVMGFQTQNFEPDHYITVLVGDSNGKKLPRIGFQETLYSGGVALRHELQVGSINELTSELADYVDCLRKGGFVTSALQLHILEDPSLQSRSGCIPFL
ncbi:hypothetical protein EBR96_01890 [bacterium]|nr:hypothetical protein [bacterium]